jgi:hypothetical protein
MPTTKRQPGLYVGIILGSNACAPYASAMIDGRVVTIYAGGHDGVIRYRDGQHTGKPALFRGIDAVRAAGLVCRWNNQRFTYDVARGHRRAEGVELVGAAKDTDWRS